MSPLLMDEWLLWCIGCYTTLFLAPSLTSLLARLKVKFGLVQYDSRNKSTLMSSPRLPSNYKYSPLRNTDNEYEPTTFPDQFFSNNNINKNSSTVAVIISRLESITQLFNVSNRGSVRWRMLLALALWLSYVVPVTIQNEPRDFYPSRTAPSFDINHPEPLCSAREMEGFDPRFNSFEGYWQEYLQFHEKMVTPEYRGGIPEKEKKYLVFQPSDDGLGNRLQALLSSVVLAMLTRRAFILDWVATPQCNANFTDLFQQPENLNWALNATLPNHKELKFYKEKEDVWYPYCRNCALRSPITPESTWSNLLCNQNLGIDHKLPLIQILSTQWYLPVIQHNPFYRRELCHMFPQVKGLQAEQSQGFGNAFQVLAQKLLTPSSVVQQKIDSVTERIPKGVKLIGLQVRRTENNAVGKGIEDSFLSCAAKVVEEEEAKVSPFGASLDARIEDYLELNKDHHSNNVRNRNMIDNHNMEYVDDEGLISGIQHDNQPSSSHSTSTSNTGLTQKYAYFLATDYRPTRAHFQKVLGDRLFVLDNTFQSQKDVPSLSIESEKEGTRQDKYGNNHSPNDDTSDHSGAKDNSNHNNHNNAVNTNAKSSISQTEAVMRNSVNGVQLAVAEMYLLAQADRIIASPYSTFGSFAHGYSNIQPNIVKRDGTCIKRQSTQPCFQYWFGFANGGAKCSIKATVDMSEDYDCWL
ncbi:hypothetical protein BGZ76_009645 [Entomortierella beljakovae]|nr:hypothetical protein BGZ76_009645 [Entomortierella beljakovae]